MVSELKINKFNIRVHSSFYNFFKNDKKNLLKINNNKINKFVNKLNNAKFDGWFSSIEDKIGVEVALLNNKDLFEIETVNNFNSNWNYKIENNNEYINFGKKYKIYSLQYPLILIINIKFKINIDKFIKRISSTKFIPSSIIEIILKNANIIYFNEYK